MASIQACFADRASLDKALQVVAQRHQRRDGGVELETLQAALHTLNRLVDFAHQLAVGIGTTRARVRWPGSDHIPHIPQPAVRAVDLVRVPGAALLPIKAEHQIRPHGIRTEAFHQFIGIDDVALALGHPLDFQVMLQLRHVVLAGDAGDVDDGILVHLDHPADPGHVHMHDVLGAAHDLAEDTLEPGRHIVRPVDDLNMIGEQLFTFKAPRRQDIITGTFRAQHLPLVAQL
jgi:sugar phosphate isomerase/epimerase